MGVGTWSSPPAQSLDGRSGAGHALFPAFTRLAVLGGTKGAVRTGGVVGCNRADVHPSAKLAPRPAKDWPTKHFRAQPRDAGCRTTDGRGSRYKQIEPTETWGGAVGIGVVGSRSSNLATTASTRGCTDAHGDSAGLWGSDAARYGRCCGRVSEGAVVRRIPTLSAGTCISDHLWLGGGIHGVHVAAATLSADAGGDAHLCQSRSGSPSGMAVCG